MGLTDRLLAGDVRALARLATLVENDDPVGREALIRLYPRTGRAHVVGVTGPPGAGKSTLVDRLIGTYRAAGRRVGVIAVDPTSPRSGGATLGDRVRMMGHHADPEVFIRSMASRGQLGGLAVATAGIVHLLDAAGYDPVLVETVGVGQDEVEVARLAHTVVVVQVPGTGDSVQAIKAGLLEVGDVLVVNKADAAGADALVRDLTAMLTLVPSPGERSVPVLRTVATTGEGVESLHAELIEHLDVLRRTGEYQRREQERAAAEVVALLRREVHRWLAGADPASARVRTVVGRVAARQLAPAEALAELVAPLAEAV